MFEGLRPCALAGSSNGSDERPQVVTQQSTPSTLMMSQAPHLDNSGLAAP